MCECEDSISPHKKKVPCILFFIEESTFPILITVAKIITYFITKAQNTFLKGIF